MKKLTALLLSLAGTAVSAAAFILSDSRNKKTKPEAGISSREKAPTEPNDTVKELYKTAGIKKAEVKKLTKGSPTIIPEFVTGTAIVRPDDHDKYNVDITNEQGSTIGHVEKNRRLCNSLEAWHQGKIFTFVKVTENPETGNLSGTAFIPAGFDEEKIKMLKEIFQKLAKRNKILSGENINSDSYLEILDDHKFISQVMFKLNMTDIFDISLSKRIIPALSKQLEDEQNWAGLLKLEQHSDLIDELSERFAGTTYKRISKAKKNTGQKI